MSQDQTLANLCYKQLKEDIIRGIFSPGEKLRIEKLKEHLKVGPTPIREALSRLTSSGLVDAQDNRGFYVRKISEAEVCDIYNTFTKIEILALTQAMEVGDLSWEAQIQASLHKLSVQETSKASIDPHVWLQLNYEFHHSLVEGCKSPTLLSIRNDLYQMFDRYCHLSVLHKRNLALNNKEHRDLAKAVIERNKSKACELMTAHIGKSFEIVIEQLKNDKVI